MSADINEKKKINSPLAAKEWQAEFTHSLFEGLSTPLKDSLKSNTESDLQERFSIYQNNVFYSLSNALADLYPTIQKLVGEDFFNGTANAYIRENPPTQAAMVFFGLSFPAFLSSFAHTQNMPYLVDIAKLELARHQAYHAADIAIIEKSFFATLEARDFERSTVELHPSLSLLESRFPVFTIWQSNQENVLSKENRESNKKEHNEDHIQLDEPQWLIVVRCNYEVMVFNIDYGTYSFYHNLLNKKSINDAAQFAQETQADVDISSAIALGINSEFFTHLHV